MRTVLFALFLLLTLLTTPAQAQVWSEIAHISGTLGVSDSRICIGEASRGELGCPSFAPTISPTGRINASAGLTVNSVSLTTTGTTWGYLGSGGSYLPNLTAAQVSATAISTTAVQIASSTTVTACSGTNAGTLRYNSTNTALELCTGSGWQIMGVGIPAGTISAFASTTCPTGWSEYTPARGRFLRGIDNGAGNDPDGTRAAGGIQLDALQEHVHSFEIATVTGSSGIYLNRVAQAQDGAGSFYRGALGAQTVGSGRVSTETRPKNVAVTFCQFNGTSNGWNNPLSGGSTSASGSTGQIQYNTGGSFDASAGLTWDNAVSRLAATNISATALTVNGVPVTGSAATDRLVSGSNVLRLSNSASLDLLTTGEARLNVLGGATSNASVELGNGRTGNGFSYIDLVGDTTYSDYGLRLIRDNAGPNANSWLQHRGTGGLNLMTVEAAPITFTTNSTERMRVAADGNVGIGTSNPTAKLTLSGGNNSWLDGILLNQTGANGRLYSVASRENGQFAIADETAQLGRLFIDASGNIGVGTSTPGAKLHVDGGGALLGSVAIGQNAGGLDMAFPYESIGSGGTTNLRLQSQNAILFHTGMTSSEPDDNSKVRVTIDTTGNVGIGAVFPEAALHIYGQGGTTKGLKVGGENVFGLNLFPGTASPDSGYLTFGDGSGWKFHIGMGSDNGSTKFLTIVSQGVV